MRAITHPTVRHPSPEALLLFALGAEPASVSAARDISAHAVACESCGVALDRILEARFDEEEAAAPARIEARDATLSPRAARGGALRAAAADARTFDAPAAPALVGTAWLASGDAVSVFRRPDAPSTFALDRRDLFGRRVTIRGEGGAPVHEAGTLVDRFGRMRLSTSDAEALVGRLAAGERLTLDPA